MFIIITYHCVAKDDGMEYGLIFGDEIRNLVTGG